MYIYIVRGIWINLVINQQKKISQTKNFHNFRQVKFKQNKIFKNIVFFIINNFSLSI